MNLFKRVAIVAVLLAVPAISQAAFIRGDVSDGGVFSGSVSVSNAWVASNPIDGGQVNFWTLTGVANQAFSIVVESGAIEFGISLYTGLLDEFDLIFPGFDNAGDIGDNRFVAGTPFFGAAGTFLEFLLPQTGTYTLAVGGEEGLPLDGTFNYTMKVTTTPVPEPAAWALVVVALFGVAVLNRGKLRRAP
ncbi:MAG TPA: hypothetical protein VIL32_16990 [Steroidobacteraceae bacterium]